MALICDVGKDQRIKHGEVICGDSIEIVRNSDGVVVVLSDGLGSGVKANILSNLTSKIISKMVMSKVPLLDIVETIAGTLPVCSIRGVAYSTFTIMTVSNDGKLDLIDFDGVPPIRISDGFVEVIERTSREVAGKIINEAHLQLKEGDYVLISSDGVTEAGLGLTLPMGLQTKGVVKALKENVTLRDSAQDLVDQLIGICMSYYINEPGDDTTAVAVHIRQRRECALMTGAPLRLEDDPRVVSDFLAIDGRKVICGGTTANIFARETQRNLIPIDDYTINSKIPPTSKIDGVDLVTEGMITINYCTKLLENHDLNPIENNGATKLLKELLAADKITIFLGTQISDVYDNIKLTDLSLRNVVIDKLKRYLEVLGKEVVIHRY